MQSCICAAGIQLEVTQPELVPMGDGAGQPFCLFGHHLRVAAALHRECVAAGLYALGPVQSQFPLWF